MAKLRLLLASLGAAALALVAADRLSPPDLTRYHERSLELLDREGRPLSVLTTTDGKVRLATGPGDVDRRYLDLLLRVEDRRFWWHPGVDPLALARAVGQLATHGRIVSGGSTITMQVARLLTPHRHDVVGKLRDIVRALQLEAHFDKREILSMYLTLAPMGGNLEGIRAASFAYFEHAPTVLSPAEAALLVALPQSPSRLRPDRHGEAAVAARARMLARLASPAIGVAPTSFSRHALPELARHVTDRFRLAGRVGIVRTTLDAKLQAALEELAARERQWLGTEANVAALVVANRDRAVLAYLGGVDYFGQAGMVDMIRARRSPGSTLKPFIYGIAFDEALITPGTLMEDGPAQLGDYEPHNFDRNFHGLVTAREALQQSYNLPAVQLLAVLDPGRFATVLRDAGAELAFPHGRWTPSLPLALGGVGIDLADLAMLYAALADGGRALPLRLEPGAPSARAVPLMTEAAAWQVGDILRGAPLPDGLAPARPRAIAYKTGTSYGFRDALAIGSSRDYTVAVWVGRTEGTPRPGAFGRNTAAPLLFRIFDLLPQEDTPPPPPSALTQKAGRPLAAALRRFAVPGSEPVATFADAAAPRILYPPPGTRIDLARLGDALAPLALEASGGTPPYRWVVNGIPLPPIPVGASASWHPDGPGFARISVIDAKERTATAEIRLE